MANGDGYEGSGRHTFAEGDNGRTISCEAKVATFTYAVIDSASLEVVGELPDVAGAGVAVTQGVDAHGSVLKA